MSTKTKTRKDRLQELEEFAKASSLSTLILKPKLVYEAQIRFGVSDRTAKDYAKAVLRKLGRIDAALQSDPEPKKEPEKSEA
jgi:hypothetical protein